MLELLAPARNRDIGICAINSGADAVYIGAPRFGARADAGNTLDDLAQLADYAHQFDCKVLVTLNTILTDSELIEANRMAWELYRIGIDALIIQDFGLLKTGLPPIRLHASTQCNNATVEHVKWLEQIGFSRVVLARELSIKQIQAIRRETSIELEAFIHGALCVSYSGQCYLSEAMCGRSANRGECAQMCRMAYDLMDADGKRLLQQKHLLSLYDMNRAQNLQELIEAGVTTFKIEGRLKDENYVKNIVTYYRQLLDNLTPAMPNRYIADSGSTFVANPQKTFHRSETDYFLHGRTRPMANHDTPKSTGEKIGTVTTVEHGIVKIATDTDINLGDGICIASEGFAVSSVSQTDKTVTLRWDTQHSAVDISKITRGATVFRNLDLAFNKQLNRYNPKRKRIVDIKFQDTPTGYRLNLQSGRISVSQDFEYSHEPAANPEKALLSLQKQLAKLGDSIFRASTVEIQLSKPYFIPISIINDWRRQAIEQLQKKIKEQYSPLVQKPLRPAPYYSPKPIDYHGNIFNSQAKDFYLSCGAKVEGQAFEKGERTNDSKVELMRCCYCIKYELGWCKKNQCANVPNYVEPLFLVRGNQMLQLHFDCQQCQMIITRKQ